MSFANPDANLTLSFEGLAIYNLNKDNNFWEFLFLRHLADHKLRVSITRKYKTPGHESDSKLIHSFTVAKEHSIIVEAGAALPTPDGKFRYEVDDFRWDPANQAQDVRWMEESFGEENEELTICSFNAEFPKKELSFLSINGPSILYTQKLTNDDFEIWEKKADSETGQVTKTLKTSRKMGVIVAADLEYPPGESIKLKIEGPNGFEIDLKIAADSAYEIRFDNTCDGSPSCQDISDYQFYYDLLTSPSGIEYEIVRKLEKDPSGKIKADGTPACRCRTCRSLTGFSSLSEVGKP